MRRVIFLALLVTLICVPTYAQRGGGVDNPVNLMPLCTATSGSCPAQDYFCHDADFVIWHCYNGVWNDIKPKKLIQATDCSGYTTESQVCWDSDNDVLYIGDGTTAQPITGGGGSGTSTIQEEDSTVSSAATTLDFQEGFSLQQDGSSAEVDVSLDLTEQVKMSGSGVTSSFSLSSLTSGDLLIYDGSNSFDNKTLGTDATISSEGELTISANAVALTQDTTGDYVDDATGDCSTPAGCGGLELTGTEGATLGMLSTCSNDQVLKYVTATTSWVCSNDAGAASGQAVELDLGNDGPTYESLDLGQIATTGDTNSIFTEPSADKLLIDLANDWPSADFADLAGGIDYDEDATQEITTGGTTISLDPADDGTAAYVFVEDTCTDAQVLTFTTAGSGVSCVDAVTADTNADTECTGDTTYYSGEGNCNNVSLVYASLGASNAFTTGLQTITGDTDESQLQVIGHSAQTTAPVMTVTGGSTNTADVFLVEKSDNTLLFSVDNDGNSSFGGNTSSITAQAGQDLNITAAGGQSITLGDGGSLNYVNVNDGGAITFSGTAGITLPNGSVQAAHLDTGFINQQTDFSSGLCSTDEVIKKVSGTWACAADATGGTPGFGDITTGTNSGATMTVNTGASIVASGSGSITATALGLSSTPTACTAGNVALGITTTGASDCTADDDVPEVGDFAALLGGDGITNTAGTLAVDLNATLDGAGSTSSLSGMEFTATDELALLQGCTDTQILAWNDTAGTWGCAADAGAGTTTQLSVNGGTVMASSDLDDAGDITFIECTGAAAPDGNCVADNDVILLYGVGSIFNADINGSANIDITKTDLVDGNNISFSGSTLNVDDAFVTRALDDTMEAELTIDSDGTASNELTVRVDGAGGGVQGGILITTDDTNEENYDPFTIQDTSATPNTLFAIDHTGAVTTGIWQGTEIVDTYLPDDPKTETFVIYSGVATAGDDLLVHTNHAISLVSLDCVATGATTPIAVTVNVVECTTAGASCSATAPALTSGSMTALTTAYTDDTPGAGADGVIEADKWWGLEMTTLTTEPDILHCTVEYTRND